MCHGSTTRIITKLVKIMEATTCIAKEESATMFLSYFISKIKPFSMKINKAIVTGRKKNPISSE
jgi:hypothetical protein